MTYGESVPLRSITFVENILDTAKHFILCSFSKTNCKALRKTVMRAETRISI